MFGFSKNVQKNEGFETDTKMDSSSIIITEKPSSVSWEQISEVLVISHAHNREQGIILPFPHLPPCELQTKIEGHQGRMFVAMDGEKLVGTAALFFINKKLWCGKGKYAYCCLASILPDYAGLGIYRRLEEAEEEYVKSCGCNRMMFDSHEKNTRIFDVSRKNGYKFIEYRVRKDHRSILMVKWLDKCPYPDFVFKCLFPLIKFYRLGISRFSYIR